jgi:pentatricopeptide repeat protein
VLCCCTALQEMMYRGCERSVITYSSLISACEKAGQWELALELFQEMLREHCTPNTVTYNSLITALAQGAWLAGLSTLRYKGLPPRSCQHACPGWYRILPARLQLTCPAAAAVLLSLIYPVAAGAQWQKANDVFEQMQGQGCHPDVVTYTALISAFEKGGQWRLALQVRCNHTPRPDALPGHRPSGTRCPRRRRGGRALPERASQAKPARGLLRLTCSAPCMCILLHVLAPQPHSHCCLPLPLAAAAAAGV